ncbi:Target of rapamycin complex 1 subunit kog1 [Coemansia sp. IMI 209128]|nr:Target of rapamycin complex 1 subunit kog1 [Coemansia sp. RSA 2530]KAJ2700606.1 Target of rapamycin complex 1 subunit kog1 [Coemansia sp. IMI 209128]
MSNATFGSGDASEYTSGIASVTLGPARDNEQHPAIITTTATGANVELSELLGGSDLLNNKASKKAVSQTLMETREDFHTHPRSLALANMQLADWRGQDKLRTSMALLVVCLHLGVPPPDSLRPEKSAVLEAWVDPTELVHVPTSEELALQATAAAGNNGGAVQRSAGRERSPIKAIGESLLRQFEQFHRHARYKQLLECVMEDLRKYAMQLRRTAKDDRVMFYYNGHGVPRPTISGDIWVFNRQVTQYIPVGASDLMSWVGTPCIYIWDCSMAMNVVQAFEKNAKLREQEIAKFRQIAEAIGIKWPINRSDTQAIASAVANVTAVMASSQAPAAAAAGGGSSAQGPQQPGQGQPPLNTALINLALLPPMHHEDIHFAATQADEYLPTNPELPADLFTACLTTPIKVALRFWVIRNPRTSKVTVEMCDQVPGSVLERRTPIGELNWIFTSITDTIAWSTMPREQFRKFFRQDMAVASLYRNFMLADRVMRFYGVHPQVTPPMPPTHKHPLWDSLDLEIDMCLQQLPRLLRDMERKKQREDRMARSLVRKQQHYPAAVNGGGGACAPLPLPEFKAPLGTNLEIAGDFVSMSCRHGSRIGLGGTIESEDDESDSDGDSDGGGGGPISPGSRESQQPLGYVSSSYFSNQLYAFEVWLQHAATVVSQFVSDRGPDQTPRSLSTERPSNLDPPDELPAVLQVLLSQQYRLRALILLYRFMNLGPWAVDLAMSVGIYPYMTKLLASTTTEIREILILVWARLSAVDMALHPELMKRDGFDYFVAYLANNIQMQNEPVSDKVKLCDTVSAASAFTLAMLCRDNFDAQQSCFNERVLDYFLVYLQRPDNGTEERACLRTWILLCLAELWKAHPNAKWMAITYRLCVIASKKEDLESQQRRNQQAGAPSFEELLASSVEDDSVDARNAQDLLIQMAFHRSPIVRASAIYAIGTLVSDLAQLGNDPGVVTIVRLVERQFYAVLLQAAGDGSPMVRREVVNVIGGCVFASYMGQVVDIVARVVAEDLRVEGGRRVAGSDSPLDVLLAQMYKAMLRLSADAHPDVALAAQEACDVLMQCYAHSQAFFDAEAQLDQALHRLEISRSSMGQAPILGFLRTATTVGDALLGQPPQQQAQAQARGQTPNLRGQQQTPTQQSQQVQRRLSAHTNFRAPASPMVATPWHRGENSGQVSATPSHRYTMHSTQTGSAGRGGVFGDRSVPQSPTPASGNSVHRAESLESSESGATRGSEQRFTSAEALRQVATIAEAWRNWGQNELRKSVCVSTLVDWAGAHFTEFDISLFANVSGPLRGSAALVESRERHRRIERMETSARRMGAGAGQMKWVDVNAVATGALRASTALLHPLDPHAIVATKHGLVNVYDWENRTQVGQWSIGPPAGRYSEAVDISALHLINPLGQAKLLVGTADGMVRIFASHAPDFELAAGASVVAFPRPRLLTAFMSLPWVSPLVTAPVSGVPASTVTSNQRMRALQQQQQLVLPLQSYANGDLGESCGLATAWNQRSGVLFAGGNDKEIRIWDITAEMCIEEITVAPLGGVTCVSHDGVSGNIFATGSTAGVVRVMDRRMDARTSPVANWREHAPSSIRNVVMRPGHMEVVSAAANGEVKYWDLRHREPMYTLDGTHTGQSLRHMLAHEHAPVTLTASEATVKLWNQRGNNIGVVTSGKQSYGSGTSYMKSLAGFGPKTHAVAVSAVAMHSYLPVALMVTDDGRVSYIQPKKLGALRAHHPPALANTRSGSLL